MVHIFVEGIVYACIIFGEIVPWVTAPCDSSKPVNIWPLGQGIGAADILTNNANGIVSNVQYMPSPPNVGGYNTMKFNGTADCFAEIIVPSYSSINAGDFAIQFHAYFDDVTNGTIMEFRSDQDINNATTEINQFRLYLTNGNLKMKVDEFGTHDFITSFSSHLWYHIVLRQDMSKLFFSILVNGSIEHVGNDLQIAQIPVVLPGSIKLGGDYNQQDPFKGAIACIQWVPCKDSTSNPYNCHESNWQDNNDTTSSTISYYSTTSSIITSPMTTASPTTIATTQPSVTSSVTPTTTTLLTVAPNTSPIASEKKAALSPGTSPKKIKATNYDVYSTCVEFKMTAMDATFAVASDVIGQFKVFKIVHCLNICVADTQCSSFAVKNLGSYFLCKPSFVLSASTIFERDSMVYQLR